MPPDPHWHSQFGRYFAIFVERPWVVVEKIVVCIEEV